MNSLFFKFSSNRAHSSEDQFLPIDHLELFQDYWETAHNNHSGEATQPNLVLFYLQINHKNKILFHCFILNSLDFLRNDELINYSFSQFNVFVRFHFIKLCKILNFIKMMVALNIFFERYRTFETFKFFI